MEIYLKKLEANRQELMTMISSLTEEEMNLIPKGHANNIIWNLGHMLLVSESILYKNLPVQRPVHRFDLSQFARNTSPHDFIVKNEFLLIGKAFMETASIFREIINLGNGNESIPVQNMQDIITEERLQFLLFHDSIHYKTINTQIKLVKIKPNANSVT
jgi:hypothetical protein